MIVILLFNEKQFQYPVNKHYLFLVQILIVPYINNQNDYAINIIFY